MKQRERNPTIAAGGGGSSCLYQVEYQRITQTKCIDEAIWIYNSTTDVQVLRKQYHMIIK